MSEERGPLIERFLERTARAISGGALHPMEVLAEVERVCLAGVQARVLPNHLRVTFSPRESDRYASALAELRDEIEALVQGLARRLGYGLGGTLLIQFAASGTVAAGDVEIAARFAADTGRPLVSLAGQTTRITRQRGAFFVLADGSRSRITHTPFSIGRGASNDLVLASMAVSREHARVTESDEGLVIEDLGGRNGIVADGVRWERVPLSPGRELLLGDIELRFEGGR